MTERSGTRIVSTVLTFLRTILANYTVALRTQEGADAAVAQAGPDFNEVTVVVPRDPATMPYGELCEVVMSGAEELVFGAVAAVTAGSASDSDVRYLATVITNCLEFLKAEGCASYEQLLERMETSKHAASAHDRRVDQSYVS